MWILASCLSSPLAHTILNCLFCYLRRIQRGKTHIQNPIPNPAYGERRSVLCKTELSGHCQPGPACRRKSAAWQAYPAPFASHPSPCLSPFHLGWRLYRPSSQPPQQSRCIQRHSEAIWQKEKEAFVSLQSESHNLFFSETFTFTSTSPCRYGKLKNPCPMLGRWRRATQISGAAGPERNDGAPFLLKNV